MRLGRAVRAALFSVAAIALASSCGPRGASGPDATSAPSRASARTGDIEGLPKARYLVSDSASWVERTSDGLDRVIANGCRIEARGSSIERVSSAEPEVEAGFPLPPWVSPAPSAPGVRYLFWKDKELYGAPSFMGELTKIAITDADIGRAFDWIDGAGLLTATGALLVRDGAAEPFPLPGVVGAVAADARRAVALTTFGHTWLTQSGAAGFRDVSAELGEATRVEVRGEEIVILLQGERRRFVGVSGAIADSSTATGPRRGARPPEIDEKWPASSPMDAIDAAASSGIPLGAGAVMVATRGYVARMDSASTKATASAEIPEPDAACAPIRVPDALLLACEGKERASILDVTAVPRVERTFDLVDAADYDRFVGVDGEAVGFIGPCDGTGPKPTDLDAVTSASPYNTSSQRSAVFCARASRESWVEHRLDPADQADVIAWIPRAGGEAVALIARPGIFIADADRVTVRGKLRVVRVARSEPPLAIPQYNSRSSVPLTRSLRALPDGSIEGWLPTTSYPSNTVGATIDPEGHVRLRATPSRASSLSTSGAFAMAQTEDGKLFESVDWGRRWIPVEPPPGNPSARLSSCSAAGCRVGPFFRFGWTAGDPASKSAATPALAMDDDDVMTPALQRVLRERQYKRPPPAQPIVRLRCGMSSAGVGARMSESFGFGITSAPVARSNGPSKLAWLGTLVMPWNGSQMTATGDAEVAWLPLFDVAAPIRRTSVPLSKVSLELRYRPYDVRLGYVINADGHVDPIAVGPKDVCVASVLEQAGLVRPIGGCAAESAIGVDLGSRILLHSARYGGHVVSAVDLPAARIGSGGAGKEPAAAGRPIVIAQRELYKTPVASGAVGYVFAVGSRAGAPVVIAVDGKGSAVLAPIDPDRGTLGAEERVAPLTEMSLGSDPRCAKAADQARVLLQFDTEIGLVRDAMPGVSATGTYGLAVVRWSPTRACLDAIELSVRDERYELDLGYYEPPGTVRKLVARFVPPEGARAAAPPVRGSPSSDSTSRNSPGLPAGSGNGTLALVMYGAELRQRVQCSGIGP